MSYRFHLMSSSGRCKTAICEVSEATLQPCGPSQMLDLPETNGDEHTEDARLFTHRGEPYVSYTEMTGYQPGVDFKCVMKYARLALKGNRWKVLEAFMPAYGRNNWRSKEKNWVFFEQGGRLYCIYQADPDHRILEIKDGHVVNEYTSERPLWEWGVIRGGTPPLLLPDGDFLTIFHSSVQTEAPPAYVRYFAAAYTFEGRPPFRVLGISSKPILCASEEDGHRVDPRYIDGWKPYVVFPCGLVESGRDLLISFGINDWQSAIARLPATSIELVPPDGSQQKARYFRRENGSMVVGMYGANRQSKVIHWMMPVSGPGCSAGPGYVKILSPREAQELSEIADVREITEQEFNIATRTRNSASMTFG